MDHIGLYLKDIYVSRKTGLLSARGAGFQKQLYFQEGNLIFIKTNVVAERLGEVLFRMKKIPEEVYTALPGLVRPDAMIGEVLVKKGLLSQKDLYEGIVAQMTIVALSLFPRFDTKIAFQTRPRFFEDNVEHEMKLPVVIAEGIREMPASSPLAEFFAGKVPFACPGGDPGCLTTDERSLLLLIDGKRRSEDVRNLLGEADAMFWNRMYLLFCLNLIGLREDSASTASNGEERREEDLESRLRDARELLQRLPQMTECQILGVASDAKEDEIKKAYFKLARKYHPDLFGRHLAPESRAQIAEVFDTVTKAYRNVLREKRVLGASAAAAPGPRSAPGARRENAEKPGNPETLYRQGKTLFNQARYEEAIVLLEEAARIKDDKADYFLLLALAQSHVPSLSKKTEKSFLRAIELESWNPEGLVGLGRLYKREGLLSRARKQFERALEMDRDHKIARQELEAMKEKPDPKKGLAGILNKDLFGSKKK
jgi:curved DNA-binding protein CbpA